jgi:hypothetical protein
LILAVLKFRVLLYPVFCGNKSASSSVMQTIKSPLEPY